MAVDYFWNVALSEALYAGLAVLEVTLRSSIHAALTNREGTDMWFRTMLEPRQLREYAPAMLTLRERHKGRQRTSGQVVAELTFGFWTTLLSQPYHQTLWAPNHTSLVKDVFPNLPPVPNNRHYVHQRYNELRKLRNRVFHHERIWERPRLAIEHREMIEAIAWVSPAVRDNVILIDHFPDTYQHGRSTIGANLKANLRIP